MGSLREEQNTAEKKKITAKPVFVTEINWCIGVAAQSCTWRSPEGSCFTHVAGNCVLTPPGELHALVVPGKYRTNCEVPVVSSLQPLMHQISANIVSGCRGIL